MDTFILGGVNHPFEVIGIGKVL